jgi:hypothetical protein
MSAVRATPSPCPPASGSAPLQYLKQHHELEEPAIDMAAFRPFWRVQRPIDRLYADGLISYREWEVACAYRNMHAAAFGSLLRASQPDGTGSGSRRGDGYGPTERQLAAVERLRRLPLNGEARFLVELVAVEDLRWCQIGKRIGRHPCTAKRQAIDAVRRLAQVW